MKIIKTAGGIVVVLLAAICLTLAIGIPGGFVTTLIENRVEKDTGYQLDINGGATIRLWPSTRVTLSDVAVHDPKDRDIPERFRADSIEAELSLRSLISGNPRVREISINRPVVNLPMSRERVAGATATSRPAADKIPMLVDRIIVADATVIFKDVRNRVESRIEQVNVKAVTTPGRKLDVTADARAGTHTLKLEAKTTVPPDMADSLSLPVDFKLEALSILPQAVTGSGEVKLNGSTVTINSLTGTLGTAQFSGYGSVEATAKPLVKINLDFKQLDIDTPAAISTRPVTPPIQSQAQVWSSEIIDLDGLNYVDADVQVSAAQLNIGAVRFAPARIEGTVAGGIVRMSVSEVGMYDGVAAAGFAIDASIPSPIYALRADLRRVRALPLLTAFGDFTWLDGRMQAQIDVRTTGRSQRELLSNLSGTAAVEFVDGQIRGINLAQMIRSLTSSTLNGWQEDQAKATDLTELRANFRVEKGMAETSDLRLAGPLVRLTGIGSTDINTKTLSFRMEPKLVMTTQGQGSTAENPVGLGVPVIVEGPWSAPRIYPDMAGILENPDAAFARLREMGQGLFGLDIFDRKDAGQGGGPGQTGGSKLIDSLGSFIQGLGNQGAGAPGGANQNSQGQSGAAPGGAPLPPASSQASPSQTKEIDSVIKQLFGR